MYVRPVFIFSLLVTGHFSFGQFEYPALSPLGKITQVVGNTTIQIEYERPAVRGRKIFGGLVPWNKTWRTGAGYCTKISFDQTVQVNNQRIEAGTYSLFTIPNPEEWVIMLNSDTTLYGSGFYDQQRDIARFIAKPQSTSRYYESFTIDIDIIPNNARIHLSWDNVQVSFCVQTTTDRIVTQFIEQNLMTGTSKNSREYEGATDYLFYQNANYSDALHLAEMGLKLDTTLSYLRRVKMEIYEKLRMHHQALEEAQKGIGFPKQRKYEREEQREKDLLWWQNHIERIEGKMKNIPEQ